jgi:GNAT superfamily N-acetyltransferase
MARTRIEKEKILRARIPIFTSGLAFSKGATMEELRIRAAQPEDKEPVLAFCAHTWDWGDYLPEVWDCWLGSSQGTVLVATYGDRPVAVVHAVMASATEGWLEGLRTDPRYRRRGIATALNAGAISVLGAMGARIVRLASHGENVEAHRLAGQMGFQRVGAFVPFEAKIAEDAGEPCIRLDASDRATVLRFLDRSSVFPLTGGLLYVGWIARELTAAVVEERLASGHILAVGEREEPLALAIIGEDRDSGDNEPTLRIEYVDGATDAAGHLALALRQEAARRGLARVAAQLPDVLVIQDAFRGAEYVNRANSPYLVFAKAV